MSLEITFEEAITMLQSFSSVEMTLLNAQAVLQARDKATLSLLTSFVCLVLVSSL